VREGLSSSSFFIFFIFLKIKFFLSPLLASLKRISPNEVQIESCHCFEISFLSLFSLNKEPDYIQSAVLEKGLPENRTEKEQIENFLLKAKIKGIM
jgi:hypothetical protein